MRRINRATSWCLTVIVLGFLAVPQPASSSQSDRDLLSAAKSDDPERVRECFAVGVDPDTRDHDGRSALWWASSGGHLEVVELLLEAGADPQLRDNLGDSPVRIARHQGYDQIVDLLIAAGAVREPWWHLWVELSPILLCIWLVVVLCLHPMIFYMPVTDLAPLVELLAGKRGFLSDQGVVVAKYHGRISPKSELWGRVGGRAVGLFQRLGQSAVGLVVPLEQTGRAVARVKADGCVWHVSDGPDLREKLAQQDSEARTTSLAKLPSVRRFRIRNSCLEIDSVATRTPIVPIAAAQVLEAAAGLADAIDGGPRDRSAPLPLEAHATTEMRVLADLELARMSGICWRCGGVPARQVDRPAVPRCRRCERKVGLWSIAFLATCFVTFFWTCDFLGALLRPLREQLVQGEHSSRVLANTLAGLPWIAAAVAVLVVWWLATKALARIQVPPRGRSLVTTPSGRVVLIKPSANVHGRHEQHGRAQRGLFLR